ncbi:MAG: hypothetical protein QXQ81_02325, partial [Candidatus Thorarchaeota archaeon]
CRKGESIPSAEMPAFLSRFEYYFDYKGIDALSKKAMEAIECGCKVIPEGDDSIVLTSYKKTTPRDYLKLYRSLPRPSMMLSLARAAIAIPWSAFLISTARDRPDLVPGPGHRPSHTKVESSIDGTSPDSISAIHEDL